MLWLSKCPCPGHLGRSSSREGLLLLTELQTGNKEAAPD